MALTNGPWRAVLHAAHEAAGGDVALRALELIVARGPTGLVQLGHLLGQSRRSLAASIYPLVQSGYLECTSAERLIGPGPRLETMFRGPLAYASQTAELREYITRLHTACRATAQLASFRSSSFDIVIETGRPPATEALPALDGLPLHASAIGQILVAGWPMARVDAYLVEEFTRDRHPVEDPDQLRQELVKVSLQGFSWVRQPHLGHRVTAAVRVRDVNGLAVGAVGIEADDSVLGRAEVMEATAHLRAAANEVSRIVRIGLAPSVEGETPSAS